MCASKTRARAHAPKNNGGRQRKPGSARTHGWQSRTRRRRGSSRCSSPRPRCSTRRPRTRTRARAAARVPERRARPARRRCAYFVTRVGTHASSSSAETPLALKLALGLLSWRGRGRTGLSTRRQQVPRPLRCRGRLATAGEILCASTLVLSGSSSLLLFHLVAVFILVVIVRVHHRSVNHHVADD